jgi:hypothetical protein
MELSVALDSPRRRDLNFFDGDQSAISITVYRNDGDVAPLTVTNVALKWSDWGDYSLGLITTFTAGFDRRSPYSIVGSVDGLVTTLAYGLINRGWDPSMYVCCRGWSDQIFGHWTPHEDEFLALETDDLLITEAGDLLHLT